MRYFLIISIFFGLISCKNKSHTGRDLNLPDSTLINEVILSVIQIDSLRTDYSVVKKICIPGVYKWKKMDNDSIPPPPPIFSISYDELFSHFGSENNVENRRKDSIFILQQVDTSFRYSVSKLVASRFKSDSKKCYVFYLPIFSHDKNFAMFQYWRHCGSLCGSCHIIVLKKINGKWIKINGWGCGVS